MNKIAAIDPVKRRKNYRPVNTGKAYVSILKNPGSSRLPQDTTRFSDIGNDYEAVMKRLADQASLAKQREAGLKLEVADPVKLMRVDQVREEYGFTGEGVTVAVIDSGFNSPQAEPIAWQDFVEENPQPVDPHGHGTHVTGDILNIAPKARFISLRTAPKSGQDKHSDNAKAIRWAVANKEKYGIDVINISLGDPPQLQALSGPPYFLRYINPANAAIEEAVKAGITVVIAAGNDGRKGKYTICEASDHPDAIAVASSLNEHTVSSFSSRGLTLYGEAKPDITAPGEKIMSWSAPGSVMSNRPSPKPGYVVSQGTSFASPHIVGVVALMKQADSSLSPAEVKEILQATARTMAPAFGPEDRGAGFVDAKAALDEVMKRKQTKVREV